MIDTLAPPTDFTGRVSETFTESGDALDAVRRNALESFLNQGLPTRKTERWKYTPIERELRHDYEILSAGHPANKLDAERAASFRLPELDAYFILVANGRIQEPFSDLSSLPSEVEILSLESIIGTNGDDATLISGLLNVDDDPFYALNTAFITDGIFLRIRKGATLDRPIHIAYVNDTDSDAFIQPRSLYHFGENSEALVVETYHSLGNGKTFTNAVNETYVDAAARIHVVKLQVENDQAIRIDSTAAIQQHGASNFAVHTYSLDGKLIRNNVNVRPDATGSESHLYGLYLLDNDQHLDNHTLIDHSAAGCESNELYRGIVDGKATGIFNGKVFVRRDSQQINAYQSSQGVVLSDQARHFSKPELEIYADDVKCSHGSTTGELEPEHVFYLRSRGIDEITAKRLLLYAFAIDIVEQLPSEALRGYFDQLIEKLLTISASR